MNKFLKSALAIILAASLSIPAYSAGAANAFAASADKPVNSPNSNEITGKNVSLEYKNVSYNGSVNKPTVLVSANGAALSENTDFIVTFPEDCVNAGEKTVKINGIGSYTGEVFVTYKIEPLDCSDKNTGVRVTVPRCVYSGAAITPDITVTAGALTLKKDIDYTLSFRNNVNASSSEKAACDIVFSGNFSGKRTVLFNIEKAPSEDFELELKVNPGKSFVLDLSAMKPADAVFGAPRYSPEEFTADNKPKIAFNELRFTLDPNDRGGAVITIPVTNMKNYADYDLYFYVVPAEKEIPKLTVKPITKEYDGKAVSENILYENGSYAEVGGEKISGTWYFWDKLPTEPCEKKTYAVTFVPDDEKYETVDGVAVVTISKIKLGNFSITPRRENIAIGDYGYLSVKGIPEGVSGSLTVSSSGMGEMFFSITEIKSSKSNVREYEVQFPIRDALYTFTAEFGGNEHYAPCTAECSIKVGEPILPEDQQPEKITTAEELAQMIANAAEGSSIKAEGMRTIPAELVSAAAEKKLVIEMKLNGNYTWIVDTAKMSDRAALDLNITSAVIPFVLLEQVGGEKGRSFNVSAKNLGSGASIKVNASSSFAKGTKTFANLFLYNTDGELEFVSCAEVDGNAEAVLHIEKNGKYAVVIDKVTKMPGDCNSDCKINVKDATALLVALAYATEPLSVQEFPTYDFNKDGKINVKDVTALLVWLASN